MSKIVLRGILGAQEEVRLQLHDGKFDTGFKITKIVTAPPSQTSGAEAFIRAYTEAGAGNVNGQTWDWSDNREVAWAATHSQGGQEISQFSLVDDEAVIIEDLFLRGGNAGDNLYYLELEKISITEWEGALGLVRARSQG